ncbi:hypothetical protein NX059_008203 [Plenodomus lindquistii]|nr:hypothetical protein NX059_008203 [Plenodomus lindquistii]
MDSHRKLMGHFLTIFDSVEWYDFVEERGSDDGVIEPGDIKVDPSNDGTILSVSGSTEGTPAVDAPLQILDEADLRKLRAIKDIITGFL